MQNTGSGEFVLTLLLVNVELVAVGSMVLMLAVPERLRRRLAQAGSLADCWASILVILALFLIPVNLLILYVHGELVQIPLVVEAIRRLDLDSQKFRENTKGLQEAQAESLRKQGLDPSAVHQFQRDLWYSFPALLALGGLVVIVSAVALSRAYIALLNDLDANAAKRQRLRGMEMRPWEHTLEELLQQEEARQRRW